MLKTRLFKVMVIPQSSCIQRQCELQKSVHSQQALICQSYISINSTTRTIIHEHQVSILAQGDKFGIHIQKTNIDENLPATCFIVAYKLQYMYCTYRYTIINTESKSSRRECENHLSERNSTQNTHFMSMLWNHLDCYFA